MSLILEILKTPTPIWLFVVIFLCNNFRISANEKFLKFAIKLFEDQNKINENMVEKLLKKEREKTGWKK